MSQTRVDANPAVLSATNQKPESGQASEIGEGRATRGDVWWFANAVDSDWVKYPAQHPTIDTFLAHYNDESAAVCWMQHGQNPLGYAYKGTDEALVCLLFAAWRHVQRCEALVMSILREALPSLPGDVIASCIYPDVEIVVSMRYHSSNHKFMDRLEASVWRNLRGCRFASWTQTHEDVQRSFRVNRKWCVEKSKRIRVSGKTSGGCQGLLDIRQWDENETCPPETIDFVLLDGPVRTCMKNKGILKPRARWIAGPWSRRDKVRRHVACFASGRSMHVVPPAPPGETLHGFDLAALAQLIVSCPYLKGDEKCPLVSVGSGAGRLEYHLRAANKTVLCVDPAPESYTAFHPREFVRPDVRVVEELKTSALNSNCDLLLCWPPPDSVPSFDAEGNPNPANIGFDLNAVRVLAPRTIVLIHEPEGGAGSTAFRSWLYDNQTDYRIVLKQTIEVLHRVLGELCHELLILRFAPGSPRLPAPSSPFALLATHRDLLELIATYDQLDETRPKREAHPPPRHAELFSLM